MMSIWKYELRVTPEQTIEMPFKSKILTIQVQHEIPCLWALVDPDLHNVLRDICIRGTGHKFDGLGEYIGTFQQADGSLVWHVFERVEK